MQKRGHLQEYIWLAEFDRMMERAKRRMIAAALLAAIVLGLAIVVLALR